MIQKNGFYLQCGHAVPTESTPCHRTHVRMVSELRSPGQEGCPWTAAGDRHAHCSLGLSAVECGRRAAVRQWRAGPGGLLVGQGLQQSRGHSHLWGGTPRQTLHEGRQSGIAAKMLCAICKFAVFLSAPGFFSTLSRRLCSYIRIDEHPSKLNLTVWR